MVYDFLLVINSNVGSILHSFEDTAASVSSVDCTLIIWAVPRATVGLMSSKIKSIVLFQSSSCSSFIWRRISHWRRS